MEATSLSAVYAVVSVQDDSFAVLVSQPRGLVDSSPPNLRGWDACFNHSPRSIHLYCLLVPFVCCSSCALSNCMGAHCPIGCLSLLKGIVDWVFMPDHFREKLFI